MVIPWNHNNCNCFVQIEQTKCLSAVWHFLRTHFAPHIGNHIHNSVIENYSNHSITFCFGVCISHSTRFENDSAEIGRRWTARWMKETYSGHMTNFKWKMEEKIKYTKISSLFFHSIELRNIHRIFPWFYNMERARVRWKSINLILYRLIAELWLFRSIVVESCQFILNPVLIVNPYICLCVCVYVHTARSSRSETLYRLKGRRSSVQHSHSKRLGQKVIDFIFPFGVRFSLLFIPINHADCIQWRVARQPIIMI